MAEPKTPKLQLDKIITDILSVIEREREQTIIAKRFGLFERKETLEQIGEMLGITRERVRQLEKATLSRLRALANEGRLPHIKQVEQRLLSEVHSAGKVIRISSLAARLTPSGDRLDQSRISFLAQLSPRLAVIADNDYYHHAAGVREVHDESTIQKLVGQVIEAIKKIGRPVVSDHIARQLKHPDPEHIGALASVSKQLATLNQRWGLVKWPMVNPRNIRDKIYVILHDSGRHMHFNEIADAIKKSEFKRRDVTTQAIHNELIKDDRFVLIGRGIYALKEWGYEKGTVADIIASVLKQAKQPLHRDEIVKRVLKSRFVKETTILLNLQGKPQFKRVAKATYALAE